MDIMELLVLVFFAGFVHLTYMAVFVAIAIVTTQAKLNSANRILKPQAGGAFADVETPKDKLRFRLLGGIALIGLLGMFPSFITLFLQLSGKFSGSYAITIAVALIFGIISSIAGLFMNREINRRL